MSLSRASSAWLGAAALLGVGSLLAWPVEATRLDWQPALAASQPWRAWTAALVHLSALHLEVNLAGAVLVAAFGVVAAVPSRMAVAWLVAWPLTQFCLLLRPGLAHYGGLSGVLHAGVAVVALWLVWATNGRRRLIGAAVLIGLVAKVLSEMPWGPLVRHPAGWDIGVAPLAHATGLVAGLCCAAFALAARSVWFTQRGLKPSGIEDTRLEGRAGHASPRPSRAPSMIERKTHLDGVAVSALVVCCFLWGLNQVAAKAALAEVPALWQITARSLGGSLLVWLWSRWRGIALFERDGTWAGGLASGLLFAAEFACIFYGLRYTSASRMVVFIYIAPFVVALGMPLISRAEQLARLQIGGLVLAFGGVAWAFAEGFTSPAASQKQWLGDALGVLGGVFWGATTLAIRGSALSRAAAEKTLLYQLLISGLLLCTAALVTGAPWPAHLSALAWSSLFFQVAVVTFASYLVWFWLIRHYPATRVSSFTLLTPVFGLVLGALLLHEPLTARLIVALGAVATGIVLVNRKA